MLHKEVHNEDLNVRVLLLPPWPSDVLPPFSKSIVDLYSRFGTINTEIVSSSLYRIGLNLKAMCYRSSSPEQKAISFGCTSLRVKKMSRPCYPHISAEPYILRNAVVVASNTPESCAVVSREAQSE